VPIGLYQKEKATLEIFEKSGLPTTKSKSDQNITRSSIKITQETTYAYCHLCTFYNLQKRKPCMGGQI
jgi:hypothetical protein